MTRGCRSVEPGDRRRIRLWTATAPVDGRGEPCRRPWSAGEGQLAALEPPPDVEGAEGAGVEGVVEEVELSFDDDELSLEDDDEEDELSLDAEAPSEALALLRLSVR